MLGDVLIALQIVLVLIGGYQFFISFFGWHRGKRTPYHPPEKSFAVVIAAHNEEQVIGALMENLKRMKYPRKLYDIYVICDNCTDRTADIVRSFHVNAWERTNPELRGKGYAIEWMLKELWKIPRVYDAVVIFDADNLVSTDFLQHMNNDLCDGAQVVQGYLDTKNPHDSWITAAYAVSYWNVNRLTQMPRRNLGLANFLGGTGMCIDVRLLKEMGWGATSLVEDLEFTMRCVQRGIRPRFNYEARVYDEKPLTFAASAKQRLRWMQGHFCVARQYFFPLIWQGLKERSWVKIDSAIYTLNVYNLFLGSLLTLAFWFDYILPGEPRLSSIYQYAAGWVVYLPFIIYVQLVLSLIVERVPLRIYRTLITFPLFLLSWSPITIYAFFTQNNKRWSHTKHTRVLRLEDIGEQGLG